MVILQTLCILFKPKLGVFLSCDSFFDTRIMPGNRLLIVQRFDEKAVRNKDPLFDLEFKLYPNRDFFDWNSKKDTILA